ncbi:MAG: energy transducer TonB [Pseudomonadota bacterium]
MLAGVKQSTCLLTCKVVATVANENSSEQFLMGLIQKTAPCVLAGITFAAIPTSIDAARYAETPEGEQERVVRILPSPAPPTTPNTTDDEVKVSQARAAAPRGMERWVSRILAAYPTRAKREGIEGTVRVSVVVGPNARVTKCRVAQSSGSDLLDQDACKSAQRYARFEPALDAAGNPTTGSYSFQIAYKLDQTAGAPEEPSPKPPTDEKWAKEVAEMEASLAEQRGGSQEYDDALEWLDAAKPFTLASSGSGSLVIMRGFVDVRQLTEQRLAALNEGSIKPNLIFTEPDEITREPIQIVHSKLQAGVPENCVLLVQLQRMKGAQDLGDLADDIERAPYVAPAFPLKEDCGSGAPWGEGVKPGEAFEWNTVPAFVAAGGAVRVDESLSCKGMEDITLGQFTLSPFAIFSTQFLTNLPIEIGVRNPFAVFNPRVFDEVSRRFIRGAERAKPVEIKHIDLVFDTGVIGDHRDVSATFKVLDDDEADEFCTVVRLEQNASVFQRVLRTLRGGRTLQWDSRRARKYWNGGEELSAFGKAAGSDFRSAVTVEPITPGDLTEATLSPNDQAQPL